MTFLIVFFLVLFGCPREEVVVTVTNIPHYRMNATITVVSDVPSILKTSSTQKNISWKIFLVPKEERKDGSWNYEAHIQCDLEQEKQEEPVEESFDNTGIWMTFRAFPHGEFLRQTGYAQTYGEPCMGEHLDALFFLLFPNVPTIPKKEIVHRLSRWKSPVQNSDIEHIFQSDWQFIDRKRNYVNIGYQGDWESKGLWWEYDILAKGTIEGQVTLGIDNGIPINNHLKAIRDFCYEKEDRTYCQKQEILYSLSYIE